MAVFESLDNEMNCCHIGFNLKLTICNIPSALKKLSNSSASFEYITSSSCVTSKHFKDVYVLEECW